MGYNSGGLCSVATYASWHVFLAYSPDGATQWFATRALPLQHAWANRLANQADKDPSSTGEPKCSLPKLQKLVPSAERSVSRCKPDGEVNIRRCRIRMQISNTWSCSLSHCSRRR